MNAQDNKNFMTRYLAAMSGTNKAPALVDEYVSDLDPELKEHIAFFEAAFPLYDLIPEDMVAEGDKVAVRATFKGIHQGDLMGTPPTGKKVVLPIMLIYRIADGKIVEHWMSVDQLTLMQQLGVMPTASPA
jgi:predicted ester cyclase